MVWVLEGVHGLGSTGVVPGPGVYVSYHHVFKCRTPGGVLLGTLGGGVPPGSPSPDPISDQKMSFFTPIFRPDL